MSIKLFGKLGKSYGLFLSGNHSRSSHFQIQWPPVGHSYYWIYNIVYYLQYNILKHDNGLYTSILGDSWGSKRCCCSAKGIDGVNQLSVSIWPVFWHLGECPSIFFNSSLWLSNSFPWPTPGNGLFIRSLATVCFREWQTNSWLPWGYFWSRQPHHSACLQKSDLCLCWHMSDTV